MARTWFAIAAIILFPALVWMTGCKRPESPEPGPTPEPKTPEARHAPGGAAQVESDFPVSGLRAVFRNDFPFVTTEGEVERVSVPQARLGCGIKLLSGGEERLQWRLDLLGRARESIRIQTFIYTADGAGTKVAERLKQVRGEGRLVKLTVDCYTKFMPADRVLYNALELAGIQVMGLEPIVLTGTADNKYFNLSDVNMRFHEKYFVIDEEVAIVGGTNIANEYYSHGDRAEDRWRDQDVLLVGPVVEDVARAFDDNYEYFKLRREGRLPTNRAAWFKKAWWEIAGEPPPVDREPKPGRLEIPAGEFDDDNVAVRFVRHRPRRHEDYLFQAYLHLIDNANESILIENAYFVPNRAILNALMRAARRGVKVTVITNSEATNDVKGMQSLSRYAYLGLIANGVEIYEWQGFTPGKGCLHSKFGVFDGKVVVIGSCNLDPRSLGLNSEDVVLIDSQKAAAKLTEYVTTVDLPVCLKITRDQAQDWHRPEETEDKFKLIFGRAIEDWY